MGGSLPENLKELSLERHDRLRVEFSEVLWQFQVPETPLETEQGETNGLGGRGMMVMAMGDSKMGLSENVGLIFPMK